MFSIPAKHDNRCQVSARTIRLRDEDRATLAKERAMSELRYGFIIPGGEANEIVTMAREAEDKGWDGVFYWDGIYIESAGPMFDPWVMLAAIATQTSRVRIGAM